MNIDDLQAGSELDALVAEKVMGWSELSLLWANVQGIRFFADLPSLGFPPEADYERKTIGGYAYWTLNKAKPVLRYSTEIAAGMEVVALLKKRFLSASVGRVDRDPQGNQGLWHCAIGLDGKIQVAAKTAPLAICRAALKAVGA